MHNRHISEKNEEEYVEMLFDNLKKSWSLALDLNIRAKTANAPKRFNVRKWYLFLMVVRQFIRY